MPLDQSGATPLSGQVRADLLRRISSGQYAVGDKIPSLRSLAAEYEVAELTVHAAIKQLQHDGILESSSGRGTFVRALPDSTAPQLGDLAEQVAGLVSEVAELRRRLDALEAGRAL